MLAQHVSTLNPEQMRAALRELVTAAACLTLPAETVGPINIPSYQLMGMYSMPVMNDAFDCLKKGHPQPLLEIIDEINKDLASLERERPAFQQNAKQDEDQKATLASAYNSNSFYAKPSLMNEYDQKIAKLKSYCTVINALTTALFPPTQTASKN